VPVANFHSDVLQSVDQSGFYQQSVEAPRLRSAFAEIKLPTTSLENLLLLGEGGIKRHTRRFEHDQRQLGSIERIERRREIDRREIDRVDNVVGRVVARVELLDALGNLGRAKRRIDEVLGETRLVIGKSNNQEWGKSRLRGATNCA